MQLAITQLESTNLTPHNTTSNQTRDLILKLLQCIGVARHHRQTPSDFTNQLLVFYFTENTPTAQASRPLPSSHMFNYSQIRSQNMSVINRSGRKTNNPTPKMLPKLLSILPHTPYFLSSQNCFFTYLSPFLPFLASSRSFSPSSHSSPRSLSPITHQ